MKVIKGEVGWLLRNIDIYRRPVGMATDEYNYNLRCARFHVLMKVNILYHNIAVSIASCI